MNPMSFKILGDWKKEIGVPLRDALAVSMDIIGRTGAEACKHAIILMAQSARALTPQSKSKRKVERDAANHGAEYVNVWHKGSESRFYKWNFLRGGDAKGTWEQAQQIANRGLAKRSWMWGLRGLNAAAAMNSKPMKDIATLQTILGEKSCGYVLTDRLSYLMKILPPGWSESVARTAGNKIMAQARNKLERLWKSEMRQARRGGVAIGAGLSRYFLRAA